MQKGAQALMKKIGIKELFDVPHGKLQGSTVLATNGKKDLTVSQLVKSAELVLNNGKSNKPTKEDAHIIIDVMHEIADIHAKSESEKKLNEEIAVSLNYLVETLK